MSSILIKNLGALATGDLRNPLRQADSIYVEEGNIRAIGKGINYKADSVVDARGIRLIPSSAF